MKSTGMDVSACSILFLSFYISSKYASNIDCDFEDDMCSWSIRPNGSCKWIHNTGYVALTPGNSGRITQLYTLNINLRLQSCLKMKYFAAYNEIENCTDNISFIQFKNDINTTLPFTTTTLEQPFQEARIEVPASSQNFDIAIQGRCRSWCYVQIDSVAMQPGSCTGANVDIQKPGLEIEKDSNMAGEYAGIGVVVVLVTGALVSLLFIWKRRKRRKQLNNSSDVTDTRGNNGSVDTNFQTGGNRAHQLNEYNYMENLNVTSLSYQYDEINVESNTNADSVVSSYNYIDLDNKQAKKVIREKRHSNDSNIKGCANLSGRNIDKNNGLNYHQSSGNEHKKSKIESAASQNDSIEGYAILDPNETGYDRSKQHEDYDSAICVQSENKKLVDHTVDSSEQYSLKDGMYMTIGNQQHKDTDANIYNISVDNVYNATDHARQIESGCDDYDHFIG